MGTSQVIDKAGCTKIVEPAKRAHLVAESKALRVEAAHDGPVPLRDARLQCGRVDAHRCETARQGATASDSHESLFDNVKSLVNNLLSNRVFCHPHKTFCSRLMPHKVVRAGT